MELFYNLFDFISLTDNKSKDGDVPLLHLAPITPVTAELLHFLQKHHLLPLCTIRCCFEYSSGKQCENMLELKESTIYKLDRYELNCKIHGGHRSIRTNSWFAASRLPLTQLLYIFHLLRSGAETTAIVNFFREVKLYRETVTGILRELQSKMLSILIKNHIPSFDPGDELEIDEMWMDWKQWDKRVGRDSRLAQWEGGQWIIGLINRARTKLWIECIPNRKKDTIQKVVDPLLKSWLLRCPRIHTDALKSYDYLEKENTHYVINKAQDGFAIKETTFWGNTINVNVNAIENLWRHLRSHLRKRHAYSSPQFAQLYIAEFMYNWYKLNWFDLIHIQ